MRTVFSTILKITAVLCSIMFVFCTILALILFNLERRIFNPGTYKQALASQDFYDRMPALIAQALSASSSGNSLDPCVDNPIACGAGERSPEGRACFENALGLETYQILVADQRKPTEFELVLTDACLQAYGVDPVSEDSGPPVFMENLSAQDWEFIIASLFPPEDLKLLTDRAFEAIFDYLNGRSDSAEISMQPLKQRLAGAPGVQMALQMMRAQPDCSADQLIMMTQPQGADVEFPICKPPEDTIPVLIPLIQTQLVLAAAGIPEQAVLIPAGADPQGLGGLITVRMIMRLSPLIPLIFLLGITLLVVRNLVDWLAWWGIPLFIAGFGAGFSALAATPIISMMIQNFLVGKMPVMMPAILVDTVNELLAALIKQYLKPVLWQGILLASVGLAMALLAYYLSKKSSPKTLPDEASTIL